MGDKKPESFFPPFSSSPPPHIFLLPPNSLPLPKSRALSPSTSNRALSLMSLSLCPCHRGKTLLTDLEKKKKKEEEEVSGLAAGSMW